MASLELIHAQLKVKVLQTALEFTPYREMEYPIAFSMLEDAKRELEELIEES